MQWSQYDVPRGKDKACVQKKAVPPASEPQVGGEGWRHGLRVYGSLLEELLATADEGGKRLTREEAIA